MVAKNQTQKCDISIILNDAKHKYIRTNLLCNSLFFKNTLYTFDTRDLYVKNMLNNDDNYNVGGVVQYNNNNSTPRPHTPCLLARGHVFKYLHHRHVRTAIHIYLCCGVIIIFVEMVRVKC